VAEALAGEASQAVAVYRQPDALARQGEAEAGMARGIGAEENREVAVGAAPAVAEDLVELRLGRQPLPGSEPAGRAVRRRGP
jgi:hypothetical protein